MMFMQPDALLAFINRQHATAFRIVAPLAGGYQEGAWSITEPSGRMAVLKPTHTLRAVPVVRRLREVGYPTPELLFWGAAPDGTNYHVQEFVQGTPLEVLTPDYVNQLITLNRLQSGLVPEPERPEGNWSEYAYNVVFADESGWASCLRKHSVETARLMKRLARAAAPLAGIRLPASDAVHGDWSVGNFLVEQGRIRAIVDCAAAGYGTRAVDLATLLHAAYADEYDGDSGRTIRALLRDEIVSVGGTPMLVLLLIYRVMALVEFAVRYHGEAGVGVFAGIGSKILGDLGSGENPLDNA